MTTDRIISDTAILLGTTPEGMAPGNAGVTSPLAAHILLEIESCAAEAILSAYAADRLAAAPRRQYDHRRELRTTASTR